MKNKDFENLQYNDGIGYCGELAIAFFDKQLNVYFSIETEDEQIADIQYESYEKFKENWNELQKTIAERVIKYYNEEERFTYGPDEQEEKMIWWPEINTVDEVIEKIEFDGIIIPNPFIMEGKGRCINLTFNKKWGDPDFDEDGLGIKLVNEEIVEIGYKDIAL